MPRDRFALYSPSGGDVATAQPTGIHLRGRVSESGGDGRGYYGGAWRDGDNQNHYDLIEAGGQRLIFLYLGYLAEERELRWADRVLTRHRDRNRAPRGASTAKDLRPREFTRETSPNSNRLSLPDDK